MLARLQRLPWWVLLLSAVAAWWYFRRSSWGPWEPAADGSNVEVSVGEVTILGRR